MVRLAISGSAGTGKTTLASELAARYNCALVGEHYDDFFDEDHDFVKPASQLQKRISETLEAKNKLENGYGNFVADRCPVDLFNLWLSRGFGGEQQKTVDLYRRCRSYIQKYDVVVVLPWSALPLVQLDNGSGRRRRVLNSWTQLYNHSTMIGLLHQWVSVSRLLPIPFAIAEVQARVGFVMKALGEK